MAHQTISIPVPTEEKTSDVIENEIPELEEGDPKLEKVRQGRQCNYIFGVLRQVYYSFLQRKNMFSSL